MLNTIHLYPNAEEENFNVSFLTSANDISIEDLVVMNMKEFEVIQNITILGYYLETDPEKIDINEHTININYKRKSDRLDIPKYKYLNPDRVAEMVFTIEIKTNVNQKIITKKILIPVEYNGFYYIGIIGKKQLCFPSAAVLPSFPPCHLRSFGGAAQLLLHKI